MVPRVARNETENPLQQVNHDLCRRPRQEKDDKESGKSERAVQLELQENVGRLYMTRKNNPRCPFLNKTNTWKVLTIPFKQRRREEKRPLLLWTGKVHLVYAHPLFRKAVQVFFAYKR